MILFYEMMHVWKCFFIPAVVLAFVTLACLIGSLMMGAVSVEAVKAPLLDSLLESSTFWWALPRALLLLIVLALLISWPLYRRWRPRLGTED